MQTELEKYVSIVETAAMQKAVITLDYTQAEPYLQKLLENEGTDVWSHFLIANQYGTEQAHTEGKSGHGYSIRREEVFSKPWEEECTYVCEPLISISTDNAVLGISTPIYRNEKKVGVLIGFLHLECIANLLNKYEFTKGSYAFMLNSDGTLSAHLDQSRVLNEYYGVPDETDDEGVAFYNSIPPKLKRVYQAMMNGESGSMMIKDTFSLMDESISHISSTMDENSNGISEIVDSTDKFAQTLHEINSQIDSCHRIALQLQESLAQFQDR